MKKSKLLELYNSFTQEELRRIKKMISSPFFTTSVSIKTLFKFIYLHSNEESKEKLTDKEAFKYVFESAPFSQIKINKLRHKLYDLLLQYVFYTEYDNNSLLKNIVLLNYAEKKGLTRTLSAQINDIDKNHKDLKYKDEDHFYLEYYLQQARSKVKSIEDRGSGDLHIDDTSQALDKFYYLNNLRIYTLKKSRQNTINHQYTYSNITDEILKTLQENRFIALPTLKLWYNAALLTNNTENFQQYEALKEEIKRSASEIKELDIRNLCGCLQNTAKNFYKNNALYEELYLLYKIQLDNKVFEYANNCYLTPSIYYNVIKICINTNHISTAEQVLRLYDYKKTDEEKNTMALCDAEIHFHKKDFDKTIFILSQHTIKNVYLKLSKRRLHLRAFYEDDSSSLLRSEITNNRRLLTRIEVSKHHKTAHQNFLDMIGQLQRQRNAKKSIPKIDSIEKKIKKMKYLAERNWLLDKVRGLRAGA